MLLPYLNKDTIEAGCKISFVITPSRNKKTSSRIFNFYVVFQIIEYFFICY